MLRPLQDSSDLGVVAIHQLEKRKKKKKKKKEWW